MKHNIKYIEVQDGENPTANGITIKEIMGKDADLIYNFNDGVRNLGFAFVAKFLPEVDIIITLDDDTEPYGDTIQDHLNILSMRVPVSWQGTANFFTRGFPYSLREEAEVVLSHGVWLGIPDLDAPHQLVGNIRKDAGFITQAIHKGVFYPMCGMNIAFKRKLLPYMYFAPMKDGINRFADIWCGIESKRIIDKKGWAVVSGGAKIIHNKASDVFKNLQKEAKGIELNEEFWKGKSKEVQEYRKLAKRWEKFING